MSKVLVIGGGPAGLIAASQAALCNNEVTLLEKNPRTGRKLVITGKGRCNITNACSSDDLISNVVSNPRFLYSAFNAFGYEDIVSLLEMMGVATKVERGNRVFPVSDKAMDVADALLQYALNCSVKLKCNCKVQELIIKDSCVKGVILKDGSKIFCDKVIIATGGKSYPLTGSTGDGYELAKSAGHSIVNPVPSLVPLVSSDEDCPLLQGLSLRNISVKFTQDNKILYEDFGELLFTHFGVSGPVILSASAHLKDFNRGLLLHIDFKPALDEETLDKRILKDFEKNNLRTIANSFGDLLPSKLIPVIIKRWGVKKNLRCCDISKEQRKRLLEILKDFTIPIISTRPVEEAIVTRGGVKVSEVSPKTMQSKLCKGLYFCGEVLDVDAYTGGFNLQIAYSTGFLAGQLND